MEKKLYFNNMLTCALTIGAAVALPSYLLWIFNVSPKDVPGWTWINFFYTAAVMLFLIIFFGNKAREIKDPEGINGFTYGSSFGFAILSALLSGVIYAILMWVFYSYLNTNAINEALDVVETEFLNNAPDATDEMIEMAQTVTQFMYNIWGLLIMSIFSMGIWGGIIGLFSSAIIKRAPKTTEIE